MKTFLLSAVRRLKNYSQELDAKAILYDKSWEVFNETGTKELMIFRTSQELLISRNGIIQKGKWELLDIANIIIDVGEKSYLFNASYIEDKFLALKLDGTEEYMVMIEADMKSRFSLNSVKSIENYLDERYRKIEETKIQEQKRIEAEKHKKELLRIQAVNDRKKKEEENKLKAEREENERLKDYYAEQLKEQNEKRTRDKIAKEEVIENKRKEELVRKFAKENPEEYKVILRKVKKWNKDFESLASSRQEILGKYILVLLTIGIPAGLIIEAYDYIWVIIGYILGIPTVIIGLFIIYAEEKEFIINDYNLKKRIYSIIFHSIILLISAYFIVFILNNYGEIFIGKDQELMAIYALSCLLIKSIFIIILNAKTIRDYYSYISSEDESDIDIIDLYRFIP